MATRDMQELMESLERCGRFQVILVTCVNAASVQAAIGMLFMVFGIYNPGWICLDSDLGNMTNLQENSENNTSFSTLAPLVNADTNETFWTLDCDVKQTCRHVMYNPESSTVVTEWDLACDKTWISSLIISIQMTGVLFGAYVGGQLGDSLGRKVSLYSNIALHVIAHLSAIFQIHWQMYAACMFVLGISIGGMLSCSFHYALEFVNGWWRGILSSLPVWNIGCIIFAIMVFIIRDWRNVHIAQVVTSSLIFLPVFWTPESLRWLAVRGKVNQSKQVVAKIAHMNGRPCPDTSVLEHIADEEETRMGGHKYTYWDLFRLSSLRGYSFKFGFIWVVLAMSYYTISFGIKSMSGSFYLNFLLITVLEFPGTLCITPVVNRIRRRKSAIMFFTLASGSAFSVAIISLTTTGSANSVTVLALASFCKMIIISGWYTNLLFSCELHPTVVRSIHNGYLNSVARIGSIFSPYLISDSSETVYVPFLIVGVAYVLVVAIIWTLPETKGKTLEDSAQPSDREAKPLDPESA